MFRWVLFFVFFFISFLSASIEKGWHFSQCAGGSFNPLGLLFDSRLFYRIPLSQSGDILFQNSKIDIGIINWLTPRDDLIGVFANIEPIAVFDITLFYGYRPIFNFLGFGFQQMSGPYADYSPDARKPIPVENKNSLWLAAMPAFKIELFNIVFADTLAMNYFSVLGYSGYYYEAYSEAILKENDFVLANDAYLFYKWNDSWLTGANYNFLYVPNSQYRSQRLSAAVVFTPKIEGLQSFFMALLVGTFLENHYYQWMPYIGLQTGITVKL
jgi:hypothetical protein